MSVKYYYDNYNKKVIKVETENKKIMSVRHFINGEWVYDNELFMTFLAAMFELKNVPLEHNGVQEITEQQANKLIQEVVNN